MSTNNCRASKLAKSLRPSYLWGSCNNTNSLNMLTPRPRANSLTCSLARGIHQLMLRFCEDRHRTKTQLPLLPLPTDTQEPKRVGIPNLTLMVKVTVSGGTILARGMCGLPPFRLRLNLNLSSLSVTTLKALGHMCHKSPSLTSGS